MEVYEHWRESNRALARPWMKALIRKTLEADQAEAEGDMLTARIARREARIIKQHLARIEELKA